MKSEFKIANIYNSKILKLREKIHLKTNKQLLDREEIIQFFSNAFFKNVEFIQLVHDNRG